MKNLKRFVGAFLVMAVFSVFAVSCGTPSVEDVVKATSKELPKDAGNGMTVESMTYEGGNACYVYSVTSENFANAVSQGEENMAQIFAKSMSKDDPLVKAVVKENAAIVFNMVDEESGEEFEFTIPASLLK